jgi:hypothetical protein
MIIYFAFVLGMLRECKVSIPWITVVTELHKIF